MKKFSTACLTLLLSFAPVVAGTAVAIPTSVSDSKPVLIAESYNSYRTHWEQAIAKGLIARPSKVPDPETSLQMFFEARRNNDDYNAARRLSQYLVIYSEKYGVDAALQEEVRIDRMLRQKSGANIRGSYPLFNKIFPDDNTATSYAADER
ncbi:MAG: hypothetical protein DSM106950_11645 [Stigonema ocellatum SAG 48.90 = DSM 106950]|nr:hypothetical protein [Stigonema ocellatum SAG 48.90 = DSM 106950]